MIPFACRFALPAILVCLAFPPDIVAQDANQSSDPIPEAVITSVEPAGSSPSSTPASSGTFDVTPGVDAIGKLFLYFAIIAALGGATVYISRHGIPFRRSSINQDRKLEILEMRQLGNKQFLVVVGYEDTRMLLGVTPGKIDYLCPLDASAPDEQTFGALMADHNKPTPTP